ncbi:MAG: sarcosine oxidase [Alphaproteobacteria bacterium]|nr:MAG: sarcosine oxidase [Alphaproteobacteria bacterium]
MTVAFIQPTACLRRSPVYRTLVAAGARFVSCGDAAVAWDFGEAESETIAARQLALADLSGLPRIGFKGAGAIDWLADQGIAVPEENNRAARLEGAAAVARLAPAEALILGDVLGAEKEDGPARLAAAWAAAPVPPPRPRGYPVPRADSHAWFRIVGAQAPVVLAKLCAVDLRPHRCTDGTVAQTMVARIAAIVIRLDSGDAPAFHLLADSAAAGYLWSCLVDAMGEFNGRPVGLAALRALEADSQVHERS